MRLSYGGKVETEDGGLVRESTGNNIHDEMLRLSDLLEIAIDEYRESGVQMANAKNKYHAAKAKGFLQSFGKNAQEREANAFSSFQAEMLESDLAEANNAACKEYVGSLRARLAALQTLAAAQRAEASAIQYGQTQR